MASKNEGYKMSIKQVINVNFTFELFNNCRDTIK